MKRFKQAIQRIDPGYWVVLVICLLALWPFIGRASLPQETDAELHIFRLLELSTLVRGGEFYPRWAPNFYHGYGYPIFNYYAPLTYYVGLIFELMPGLDAVAGVKAVFVLGLLGAGFGMYGFVRDNWGRPSGYLAAAVYVYAPYVQYVDPIARGALAEAFSLGVFPLALWALDRLRRQPTWGRWGTAVLLVAAVILSHNLMALLFFGLLAAWVLWQTITRRVDFPGWRWLWGALGLGLGTAAFFWLPVLLERNAVNLNTLIGAGDNYDFRTHFLSWGEMLAPTLRLDWGATEPVFRFNLGIAQWLLGGVGLILLLLRRVKHTGQALFFALAAALLTFMLLPASTFLWEATPILPFFQFPWRLLGGTVAMLAILAGVGLEAVLARWPTVRVWGTAVAITFCLLTALPLTQPAPWPDFGDVFTFRMSLIEHSGRWLGTTSTADYVPATVDTVPSRNGTVVSGFLRDEPLDRVNRLTLPGGAEVVGEEITPLYFRYTVSTPEKFLLRLFLFQFPGWTVTVDGEVVEPELARPEGFIAVPIPAGEHLVEVEFRDTPARQMAWGMTAVSLLFMLLGGWLLRRQPAIAVIPNRLAAADWRVLAAAGLVTAVTNLILGPLQLLHYNSSDYVAEPAQMARFDDFGGQIALIGVDVSAETAASGEQVAVTLYWQAQTELDINFQSFVHALRPDGTIAAQSDRLNPGDFPTRRWPLDKYVRDVHVLQLPADLPPGDYAITAGLWVQTEGWRLPLLDENGRQLDDKAVLASLTVKSPGE
ncbi:6-pyruvoyl-tetrahydropterin synthase-related protein [Candidatus Leptofilum sp.]|uniref:6-pyruvoyl-tetrahydropterin synthase-related protein n=1 Tax=Candidatus Leptofilum sp. TaxID=3241576 RepID=UPI003B5A5604